MKSYRAIIFFISSFCLTVSAATVDWPQFRGPTGQGISQAINPPLQWGPETNVVWKTEIPGRGWSSPVVFDGKIVVTTGMDKAVDGFHELKVIKVDAETGMIVWDNTVLWASKAEAADKHSKNSLASSTALIDGGVIYAHFGHMGTVALNFEDGEIVWKQKVVYSSQHGSGSSPVLVDGLLVFNTDGVKAPMVTALHADTGKIAWQTVRSHKVKNKFSFSTPLVIDNRGRREIISPGSGMVGAYRPSDGKELWRVTYPMGFSLTTRPIFVDDRVYLSTGFLRPSFYAIRVDGATGDLTNSHVEWKYHKSMPKTPSPIFALGSVLTLEDGGRLQSLDGQTGELRWRQPLKGKFSASPVLVGDLLYCISEEGLCVVIRLRQDGCEILSEIELGERALASPALVDNALYIRTHPHLWKISQ